MHARRRSAHVLVVAFVLVVTLLLQTQPAEAWAPVPPPCPPLVCGGLAGSITTGGGAVAGGLITGTGVAITGGAALIAGGAIGIGWSAFEAWDAWNWDRDPDRSTGSQGLSVVMNSEGQPRQSGYYYMRDYQFTATWTPLTDGSFRTMHLYYLVDGVASWQYVSRNVAMSQGTVGINLTVQCIYNGACAGSPWTESTNITIQAWAVRWQGEGFGQTVAGESAERQVVTEGRCVDGPMASDDPLPSEGAYWSSDFIRPGMTTVSDVSTTYQKQAGLPSVKPVSCPVGTRLDGVRVREIVPGSGNGDGLSVPAPVGNDVGVGGTRDGLGVDQELYPDCFTGVQCELEVHRGTGTQTEPCSDPAITADCEDWVTEQDGHTCMWGPYQLPLNQCYPLIDTYQPGTRGQTTTVPATDPDPYNPTLPDVEVDPDPPPVVDPGPHPTPQPDPTPQPTPEPQPAPPVAPECDDPSGPLDFLNFVKGFKCVMVDLFIPSAATMTRVQAAPSAITSKAPFSIVGDTVAWIAPVGDLGTSTCPNWDPVIAGNRVRTVCQPWFTSAMHAIRPILLGGFVLAFLAPLVWGFWRGSVPIIKPGASG